MALSTSVRKLSARSALSTSALGLGGVCWEQDDAKWMLNVHAAHGMGVTYYDTAPACALAPAAAPVTPVPRPAPAP